MTVQQRQHVPRFMPVNDPALGLFSWRVVFFPRSSVSYGMNWKCSIVAHKHVLEREIKRCRAEFHFKIVTLAKNMWRNFKSVFSGKSDSCHASMTRAASILKLRHATWLIATLHATSTNSNRAGCYRSLKFLCPVSPIVTPKRTG